MSGLSRNMAVAAVMGLVGSMGHALAGAANAIVGSQTPYFVMRDGGKSRRIRGGSTLYTVNRGANEAKRKRRAAWKQDRKEQVERLSKLGLKAPKLKGLMALRASYYGAPPA